MNGSLQQEQVQNVIHLESLATVEFLKKSL